MAVTDDQVIAKLRQVHKSAKSRGYSCTLTEKNVRLLLSETKCAYTGERFDDINTISFERIDNSVGYEPGNVIPVIARANNLKSNYNVDELLERSAVHRTRYDGYVNSIELQILKKTQRIDNRRKHLEELQMLLAKELNELIDLEEEQEKAYRLQTESFRDSEWYKKIAEVLTESTNLGVKYMTPKQRLTMKLTKILERLSLFTLITEFVAK